MHRLVLGALCLVPFVALAAPFVEVPVEEATTAPGLNVVVLRATDACEPDTDGWEAGGVAAWMQANDATAVEGRRTREHLDLVVGDAFRAGVVHAAYQDGDKVDQVCGCLDGQATVSWLDGLTEGRTGADAVRAELAAYEGPGVPTDRWFALIQKDFCAGRYGDAFRTLRRLWNVLPEKAPEQRQLRLTRVATDMGVIAQRHPPAKSQLVEMREELAEEKDRTTAALDEWVVLNRILGDDAATLAWWESHAEDRDYSELIEHQAPNLFTLLVEQDRWADAGALVGDVDGWLAHWKTLAASDKAITDGYVALLSAGRQGEAARLAKGFLDGRPESDACGLLAQSTAAEVTHRSQKKVAKTCPDAAVVSAWDASL